MSQPLHNGRREGRWLRTALGYVLAGLCLIWVFHDIHPGRLLDHVATIRWGWIGLAVVFDIFSYVCQAWRWQLLLRPLGRLSTLDATEAIYVGLFTNEILPLRFGEFVRAYMVARRTTASFLSVVPSMAVERLFDGVWLAIGIGLSAMFVPLPHDLIEAGDILGITMLAAASIFLLLVLRQRRSSPTVHREPRWKIMRSVASGGNQMVEGLRSIGFSRWFFLSFAVSFCLLFFQALAFWLVMSGYGLRLSFWAGAAVLLIVHLGTAIPNAPANVGTYQFFTVVGLTLFGVDKTLASGFSVVVFVILTLPLWVLGFWALTRSGMRLASLRDEIRQLGTQNRPEIGA